MASLSSQTPANPAGDSTESPVAALDALAEQDSRWIDCYTSSICDFDPVRLSKETNQSMSQVLNWLNQPHIQATLELFDKFAQEGFNRRATAARMTALNSLDYLQDRVADLVELRRVLALVARFIQPPRAPRASVTQARTPVPSRSRGRDPDEPPPRTTPPPRSRARGPVAAPPPVATPAPVDPRVQMSAPAHGPAARQPQSNHPTLSPAAPAAASNTVDIQQPATVTLATQVPQPVISKVQPTSRDRATPAVLNSS